MFDVCEPNVFPKSCRLDFLPESRSDGWKLASYEVAGHRPRANASRKDAGCRDNDGNFDLANTYVAEVSYFP